jgi:hypothetical protein
MSEDFKILAEDITDYCNGVEASAVKLRVQIEKMLGSSKPSTKLPFDARKIQWQDKESGKGKFQLSEDHNSLDHKALLKFLNEHAGGCVASESYFYWVFQNGATIGRKLRK